jgi:hypothetical protein
VNVKNGERREKDNGSRGGGGNHASAARMHHEQATAPRIDALKSRERAEKQARR